MHTWNNSSSIYHIDFEPRPIIEDMSLVIPTLGRDILEQSLYHIVKGSACPGRLIVVNQGHLAGLHSNAHLDRLGGSH
jgi:hypothetical protein